MTCGRAECVELEERVRKVCALLTKDAEGAEDDYSDEAEVVSTLCMRYRDMLLDALGEDEP